MCRITSPFLLQRLKGSISSDARDFNNIETRAVIKFFFPLQGKAPKKIYPILIETLGEHAPSYVTVKNWVTHFKRSDFSTCVYFTTLYQLHITKHGVNSRSNVSNLHVL